MSLCSPSPKNVKRTGRHGADGHAAPDGTCFSSHESMSEHEQRPYKCTVMYVINETNDWHNIKNHNYPSHMWNVMVGARRKQGLLAFVALNVRKGPFIYGTFFLQHNFYLNINHHMFIFFESLF